MINRVNVVPAHTRVGSVRTMAISTIKTKMKQTKQIETIFSQYLVNSVFVCWLSFCIEATYKYHIV